MPWHQLQHILIYVLVSSIFLWPHINFNILIFCYFHYVDVIWLLANKAYDTESLTGVYVNISPINVMCILDHTIEVL